MDFETVLYAKEDNLAIITLNRPDKLNAYTVEMGGDLVAAYGAAREDPDVRAVILTGAGRGFCAGVDLDALSAHQSSEATKSGPSLGQEEFLTTFPLALVEFPKPVVAAINGAAIGIGITMVLPCDARLAAESAKLGLTFGKLGILPGFGSTYLLPRLVGEAKARELLLSARKISAHEAVEIGLVDAVAGDGELIERAKETARSLAACSPAVVAALKRALRYGASVSMEEAMRNERAQSVELRKLRGRR